MDLRTSTRPRRHRSVVPVLVVAVLVVLTGCTPTTTTATLAAADDAAEPAPGWNGAAVEGAPRVPAAVLTDTDGRPYDLRAHMAQRPTLVYFGYTHCPDVCPVHMATIAAALGESAVRTEQLNVVFVTVDPARDTPEVLDGFLASFDPSFVGLTAPRDEIDDVVTGLGLPAPVLEGDPDTRTYTMGHPSQVFAFDTDGRARIAYPFGTRQSQWVEDLPRLVREWS
jgi:protein SCO1/2